jgi:hypothetical protein
VKRLIVVSLIAMLSLSGFSAAHASNSVSLSILPGPFLVTLAADGDALVLEVDDLSASARGWWVTIDCACPVVPEGGVTVLAGQEPDRSGGPLFNGKTLSAEPGHGMGHYQVIFRSAPGTWTLTYGQGEGPGSQSFAP